MMRRVSHVVFTILLFAFALPVLAQQSPLSEDPLARENPLAAGATIWAIATLHRDTVFTAGDAATIHRTFDGGKTWKTFSNVDSAATILLAAQVLDDTTVWSVGEGGAVLHSLDTGAHWMKSSLDTLRPLFGICFATRWNGTIVGDKGLIYRTTDGGASWVKQDSGKTYPLLAVSYADSLSGWIAGGSGTVLHTSDGGATWSPQVSGVTNFLYALAAPAPGVVIVVGTQGTLLRTSDGGATWAKQPTATTKYFYAVSFGDSANGMAVGSAGLAMRTMDGGISWSQIDSIPALNLYAVSFRDTSHWITAGSYGLIVTRSDTSFIVSGVAPDRNSVALEYRLEQNYPNPFNPATTVEFTLGHRSRIVLSVFDILGRTVATLESGELGTGMYRREWNASGMASGIYFSRLEVTDVGSGQRFSLVKKMLLVR